MDISGRKSYIGCDSRFSYIPGTCLYDGSFSFSDFYQKSPHLLAVHAQSDIIRVTCTSLAVDKTSRVSESLDLNWQPL